MRSPQRGIKGADAFDPPVPNLTRVYNHGTCGGQSNNDGADRIHPHPPQPTATVFQVVHTGIVVEQSESYVGVERHTHVISALFRRRRSVGHLLRSHLARGNACLIQTFQVCVCVKE